MSEVLPDRLKKGQKLETVYGYKCSVCGVKAKDTDEYGEPKVTLLHVINGMEVEGTKLWSRDELQNLGVMLLEG
jgi:hypothetical protein